jgi:hypothetical protein
MADRPEWVQRVLDLCESVEEHACGFWSRAIRPADAAAHLRKAALAAVEALQLIRENGSPLARKRAERALELLGAACCAEDAIRAAVG